MEHILDGLTRNAPAMPCNTKQRLLAVPQRVYEIVLYLQRQRRIKAQNPETLFRCHKAYEELYNHDGFCRLVTQDPKLLELLYFNPRYNSTIGSPLNQPHYKLITKTNTYLAKNINELYSCIINNHTNNEPAIGIIDKYFEILEHTTNLTQNTHTLSLSTLILSSFQHLRNEKAENNALKEKIKSEKQQLNPSSTIKKTKSQINELSTQLQKYKNTITSIDTKLARLTPLLQKAIKHVSSAQQHADIKSKERTQQSLEFIETAQFVLSSNQPVQINTGLFSHSKHSVTAPTTEDMTQVMTA